MPRSGKKKFNLFLINADTESTKEGYMSAFIASRPVTRFEMDFPPPPKKPTKTYTQAKMKAEELIESIPRIFRTTKQKEVREYFDHIHEVMGRINELLEVVRKKKNKTMYEGNMIIHFANLTWDLDVLRGIIFPGHDDLEMIPTGTDSNLVQLKFGHILFRDFLKVTGFRSIRMAGMICKEAHKLDGTETYDMTYKDIPEHFEDYPETVQHYINNDVAVMDESFNIFMNQRANLIIETLSALPMTLTGFSRYRQEHEPKIIMIEGKKVNNSMAVTNFRWKWTRPYILYEIDAFKGGYCGPNPHCQYKVMKNGVCFDAVSMYPDKMSAYKHMQVNNASRFLRTERSFEEIAQDMEHMTDDERRILDYFSDTLTYFDKIDSEGFQPDRPDGNNGIFAYIATVECRIEGVRYDPDHDVAMMPFFSEYKTEDPVKPSDHVVTCNGKVISADRFVIKLSSVDLLMAMLCYKLEVISIKRMLTMSWKEMLPTQKRSVLYGYKLKEAISEQMKKPRNEQKDYWEDECGFNFGSLSELSDEEFKNFGKAYKQIIKAIPNGEYGKTVEKPIHQQSWIEKDADGVPSINQESMSQCMRRVLYWMKCVGGFYDRHGDPIPKQDGLSWPPSDWEYEVKDEIPVPEFVKCNDYAAGASITMWARWQLISMMYIFFQHGHEVWYCDTDSEFTDACPETYELIERFNKWKNEKWKWYTYYNNEFYTSDQLGNLGQFEEDKTFSLFRSLGAKNYCYVDKKTGKFKITIAGLNSSVYEKTLNSMKEDPELIMHDYFHPNIFIEPSACRKLVKSRVNFGYNDAGDWCGCVLEPYGFAMINTDSKLHLNNMRRCEEIQGLRSGTYCNNWIRKLYLSDKGFHWEESEKCEKWEAFYPLEDQSRFVREKDVATDGQA